MFSDESNGIRNDSEDHALLLAASHDCRLEVWHLGHVNGTVSFQTVNSGTTEVTVFEEAVVDIAFSPDSTAFAVASLDGCVRFFLVIFLFLYYQSLELNSKLLFAGQYNQGGTETPAQMDTT